MLLFVFTLILTVSAVYTDCPCSACNRCRPGWIYFNGSCYSFGDVGRSWSDAAAVCLAHGAYLVEIESAEENTWLVNRLKATNFGSVWIGMSEILHRGTLRWSYSGNPTTFSDWSPGQPSDPGPTAIEDCVEIRQPFSYTWNDYQCHFANRYVCETRAHL